MPELGSAYYTLRTDATQFDEGVTGAEAMAKEAASAIQASFGEIDMAATEVGVSAEGMAGTMDASLMQIQAALEAPIGGMEAVMTVAKELGITWTEAAQQVMAAAEEMGVSVDMAASAMVTAGAEGAAAAEGLAAANTAAAMEVTSAWAEAKGAMMGLFGGAMVIGGMDMVIGKAIEYGHQILQLSSAFNMTTQDAARLNAETQMVGMQGSSVMMTIARLTKAAGDETGTAATAMHKWGIDVAAFRTADVNDQLMMLSDAYHQAGDASTQFLGDVLGGRGMKLAPLIDEFDNLNEATADINFPTPSPEDIIKMERFKAQIGVITTWLQVKLLPVLIKLAPEIAAIGGAFIGWKIFGALKSMGVALLAQVQNLMAFNAAQFEAAALEGAVGVGADAEAVQLTLLGVAEEGAAATTMSFGAAMGALAIEMAAVVLPAIALYKVWQLLHMEGEAAKSWGQTYSDAIDKDAEALDRMYAKVKEFQDAANATPPPTTGGRGMTSEQLAQTEAWNRAQGDAKFATDSFNEALKDQIATLSETPGVLSDSQASQIQYDIQWGFTEDAVRLVDEAHDRLNATLEDSKVHLDQGGHAVRNYAHLTNKAIASIKDTFASTTASVIPAIDDFTSHFWSSSQKIVRGLHNQVEALKRWHQDTKKVTDDQGLTDAQKADLLQQPADIVDAWVHGTDKQKQQIMRGIEDTKKLTSESEHTVADILDGTGKIVGGVNDVDSSIGTLNTSINTLRNATATPFTFTINTNAPPSWPGGADGNINTPFPRALGGGVQPSSEYWVGEHGPELFSPDVTGTITPTSQLGKVAAREHGGAEVTVHKFRIEDWESGMGTIEIMVRDAARDEADDASRPSRMRRSA